MIRFVSFVLLKFCAISLVAQEAPSVYSISNGKVHFKSNAPLELIEAESDQLKGLIDFDQQTFAFTIAMTSFKGFNSALQREHFNENYMESEHYPRGTFSGKLIDKIDISRDGEYKVRAKGKLSIHGVEQERIIPATINVREGKLTITSQFVVMLADHNIGIPKVVQQKIAESIHVQIEAKGEKK